MSLVTPIPQNTTIKAYRGVPWDNTLQDVRLFDNAAQRDAFFQGLLLGQWNNCSVVSVGKAIRVQAYYNNCLECNYLSFVNTQEGTTSRTIYAYVTSVNYVNVNTVEFVYEVDWIQTYLFDFQFENCLVEREHVNDDTFGKYVLDERLDTGEYVIQMQKEINYTPAVMMNVLKNNYTATTSSNLYQAGSTYIVPLTDTTDLATIANLLSEYNAVPERITYFGMAVAEMGTFLENSGESSFVAMDVVYSNGTFSNAIGESGYAPKNNKLLTYPYRFIMADNYNGQSVQYRWELNNPVGTGEAINHFEFKINGQAFPKPVMIIQPSAYRGALLTDDLTQEGLTYDNFPMVPYATDAFKAWVSEYGISRVANQAASVAGSSLSMVGNILSFNWGGVGQNALDMATTAINGAQEAYSHQLHSVQAHGGTGEAGIHFGMGNVGFRITQYGITAQRAKEIDDYFTRYGYRVDAVKTPNIRGRQYVNYVKCGRGRVAGNVAVDAKLQMERALTQGVSFWHINNIGGDITSNPIVATS